MRRAPKALAAALLIGAGASGFAQMATMLNAHDANMEWAFSEAIREGRNIPTAVQGMSAAEAAFHGLIPRPERVDGAFVRGRALVQPFALGWNGLESSQYEEDDSRRVSDFPQMRRFSLNEPILMAGISFGSESFFATTQIDFVTDSQIKYAGTDGVTGFWRPDDYLSWWTFPGLAYMAWSGANATAAAGRFPAGIGLGGANLFLNGQAPWYDHLEFSWWSDFFKFYSLWGASSSQLSDEEYAVQGFSAVSEDGDSWGWDTENNHDAASQGVEALKMFTYHRLEFRPFSWLGFGVSEMQMIGGKAPGYENILPVLYWHNTYSSGNSNVMAMADVWSVPLPGLLVYGEFIMDDTKSSSESGESKPNCWGWEAGATAVLPVGGPNWTLSVNVEYSHVDQWTYNRWQPYLTMYQRQTLTGGWDGLDIPLGHPQGGDVDQVGVRFVAMTREGKRFELGYTWICKGPAYLGRIEQWVDEDGATVSVPVYYDYDRWTADGELDALLGSTRKHSHVVSLKALWPLGAHWSLDAGIDWSLIFNSAHIEGNTDTETVWKVGLIGKIGS